MAMNDWDWQLYPETEGFVSGLIRSFLDGKHQLHPFHRLGG